MGTWRGMPVPFLPPPQFRLPSVTRSGGLSLQELGCPCLSDAVPPRPSGRPPVRQGDPCSGFPGVEAPWPPPPPTAERQPLLISGPLCIAKGFQDAMACVGNRPLTRRLAPV